MKIIQSFWGIAFIGLFMNAAVVAALMFQFYGKVTRLNVAPEVTQVAEAQEMGPAWIFRSGEIEALARNLRDEKARLASRRAEIAEAQARAQSEADELKRLRQDIESYKAELETARQSVEKAKEALSSQLVEVQQNEVKNLKSLSGAYTNLTPGAAVLVFKEMDDNLAVKILSQMKPETVAAIFEEMSRTPDVSHGKDGKTLAKRVADLSEKLRLLQQPKPKTP